LLHKPEMERVDPNRGCSYAMVVTDNRIHVTAVTGQLCGTSTLMALDALQRLGFEKRTLGRPSNTA